MGIERVFTRALVIALLGGFSGAAFPGSGADSLAAVDMNRNAIIADIVQAFGAPESGGGAGAAALKARLERLRADHLLAASLASSRATLDAIIADGATASPPAVTPVRKQPLAVGDKQILALGDPGRDLVYTPLTPCRLIDTRGNGAPFQGGAFAPGERRAYVPAGACGIPTTGVATLLVAFTTQNLTPVSGGALAILAPAAPFTATVDVFNLGSEWSASNTAVATGGAGQFDVFVLIANAHVVVDALGFFGPLQGNITLTDSTATTGNILKGTSRFIHNFGKENTFVGENAGNFTITGSGYNTAIGSGTLSANTTGSSNTAGGVSALRNNTSGYSNTASGHAALAGNTTGAHNTASGYMALIANTNGVSNTAVGSNALAFNTSGLNNIALGAGAGISIQAGYNIDIGNGGRAADTGTIRIGDSWQTRTFIAGIRDMQTDNIDAIPVLIDSEGQLGTASSSRRIKDDIADMGTSSNALMRLRPVTFHYRSDKNPSGRTLQYGLIAEEVAEIYPGLVAHSADGRIETVLYQFLSPMLLNEYQRQQRTIEAQAAEIATQARRIAALEKRTSEIALLQRQVARMVRFLEYAAQPATAAAWPGPMEMADSAVAP